MIEHLPFIVTLLITSVSATWTLRAKLSDIESTLKNHVAENEKKLGAIDAKIIKLESRRARR